MKTKRNIETIALSIIIIIMFLLGQTSNAQMSIKNDTLYFNNTIKKGAVIWISSEFRVRLVKYTIRSKREIENALKCGWSIDSMKLPKGLYFFEYIHKGVICDRVKYNKKPSN